MDSFRKKELETFNALVKTIEDFILNNGFIRDVSVMKNWDNFYNDFKIWTNGNIYLLWNYHCGIHSGHEKGYFAIFESDRGAKHLKNVLYRGDIPTVQEVVNILGLSTVEENSTSTVQEVVNISKQPTKQENPIIYADFRRDIEIYLGICENPRKNLLHEAVIKVIEDNECDKLTLLKTYEILVCLIS